MNKVKLVSGLASVVAFASLLLPASAFAATTQTFLTLDGLSNNTYTVGSTFNAKLSFDLTGNDTLQSIKWEILNANNQPVLPFECQDVDPDFLTAGSYATEFVGHSMGGSQGTWKIRVSTYGVSVPGANNNCTGTPVSTRTYNSVLTLTNDNSSGTVINNTGTGNGTSAGTPAAGSWQEAVAAINSQLSQLAALIASLAHPATPTTPGPDAICSQIPPGSNVTSLQSFLMLNGQAAGFNAVGVYAPTGYLGPITLQALSNFKYAHHCN